MTSVVALVLPSTPASIVIGWLATPVPLAFVSLKMTLLLALLGVTMAEPVAVRTEPVITKVRTAVNVPLVAVMVMRRFEGSAPVSTVATEVPSAAVADDDCVNVAPLSTVNETGMPAKACPEAVVAVAVALTVAAPVFWMLAVSSARVRLAAVTQVPAAADAAEEQPAVVPLPNGEVPALPPPPPQAATPTTAAIVVKIFSNLFMRGSLAFVGAVALSAPLFGR